MRLKKVEEGHGFLTKLKLGLFGVVARRRAPDVVRTLFYRPEFFGEHYSEILQDVMRGDSDWTVGERELFAAYVSKKNQCLF